MCWSNHTLSLCLCTLNPSTPPSVRCRIPFVGSFAFDAPHTWPWQALCVLISGTLQTHNCKRFRTYDSTLVRCSRKGVVRGHMGWLGKVDAMSHAWRVGPFHLFFCWVACEPKCGCKKYYSRRLSCTPLSPLASAHCRICDGCEKAPCASPHIARLFARLM